MTHFLFPAFCVLHASYILKLTNTLQSHGSPSSGSITQTWAPTMLLEMLCWKLCPFRLELGALLYPGLALLKSRALPTRIEWCPHGYKTDSLQASISHAPGLDTE